MNSKFEMPKAVNSSLLSLIRDNQGGYNLREGHIAQMRLGVTDHLKTLVYAGTKIPVVSKSHELMKNIIGKFFPGSEVNFPCKVFYMSEISGLGNPCYPSASCCDEAARCTLARLITDEEFKKIETDEPNPFEWGFVSTAPADERQGDFFQQPKAVAA